VFRPLLAAAPPKPPSRTLILAALLSVSLVNTGYNVLVKNVVTAHKHSGGHGDGGWASGSGSHGSAPPAPAPPDGGADKLILSMLRDSAAFPILQLGALAVDGRQAPCVRDIPMLAVLGLTGMFGNQYLFIYGLGGNHVSATQASVLTLTQPVFAACLAMGAGQQKPSWLLGLGILFTVGGSIIMAQVCRHPRAERVPLPRHG
jgi:drug/metabolite transporter (DMT)-like permease